MKWMVFECADGHRKKINSNSHIITNEKCPFASDDCWRHQY